MAENTKQLYHTHITSKRRRFELNLKEVWRYRDLIVLFTKRNFTVRYKQTVLGPAWLFISPIISSLIYTFIFGGIAKLSTEGVLVQEQTAAAEEEVPEPVGAGRD